MNLSTVSLLAMFQASAPQHIDYYTEQGMGKDVAGVIIFAFFVISIISIIAVNMRRMFQNSMQKALLAKFSTAHDFAEFLQSPAGQKYVMSFTDAATDPRNTILNSLRSGIILVFLGVGCFFGGVPILFNTVGFLLVFLGFGFIVSAGVAYRLHKSFKTDKTE